ncbi:MULTISPECIES: hypothetical protein [Thioalkalivibrio]|uniref:Uncharacterized protein n=1 Tax=Thioalkalivibrio versutus TaxID=106634 RepID=A0A0G3G7H6_9GAMM|nr:MULTISPECIES: hypothetical protein [Thioalkalivibrio]AKJ94831.1 hypothetical protein TVD_05385 [Thioalkalivibrio versutus]OOC50787.1 hypothetical protein B0684_02420 [Thioalkalivibrio versutus]
MKIRSQSLAGLIAAAALALASPLAIAQGMGQGQGQGGMGMQGGQGGNPQMEMQQLQQTLAETQQQAIENNPQLEQKGEELENLVLDKMEAAGYQPRRDLETLESAEEQLRDPDLSAEQRQEVIQSEDVQQAQMNLQEAQQAVAEDQEIRQAQESLREDLMAAMRQENADIDDVIERMQQMQQQMQQQQGGQGGMMR